MDLTPKQIEVVLLLAKGHTSQEVADRLFLSRLTVDNHRRAIIAKSGCRNWNQFMAEIGTNGLLEDWRATVNGRLNGGSEDSMY